MEETKMEMYPFIWKRLAKKLIIPTILMSAGSLVQLLPISQLFKTCSF